MLSVGVYAWTNGNFTKLTTAYDLDGKGCGVDYPKFPYIYFVSPNIDVVIPPSRVYGSLYVSPSVPSRATPYYSASLTAWLPVASPDPTPTTAKPSKSMIPQWVRIIELSGQHAMSAHFQHLKKHSRSCHTRIRAGFHRTDEWVVADPHLRPHSHRSGPTSHVRYPLHCGLLRVPCARIGHRWTLRLWTLYLDSAGGRDCGQLHAVPECLAEDHCGVLLLFAGCCACDLPVLLQEPHFACLGHRGDLSGLREQKLVGADRAADPLLHNPALPYPMDPVSSRVLLARHSQLQAAPISLPALLNPQLSHRSGSAAYLLPVLDGVLLHTH